MQEKISVKFCLILLIILFVNVITRIIRFCYAGQGICLILLIFYCQRDCTDYTVLLDPCDPRDPWRIRSGVSWVFTRMILLRSS